MRIGSRLRVIRAGRIETELLHEEKCTLDFIKQFTSHVVARFFTFHCVFSICWVYLPCYLLLDKRPMSYAFHPVMNCSNQQSSHQLNTSHHSNKTWTCHVKKTPSTFHTFTTIPTNGFNSTLLETGYLSTAPWPHY